MDISNIHKAFVAGRVRHFKPYRAKDNEYYIELQELCPMADNTGDFWKTDSLKADGKVLWFESEQAALDALSSVGLGDAYNKRFTQRDDGCTVLNW